MNPILNKSNAYVFIAVRMKSSRLRYKAMLDINGKPLILRLIEELSKNIPLDKIVICTSKNTQDSPLEEFAYKYKIKCFRGNELDVIDRFINAAEIYGATTIARVTGDNPLTNSLILDQMIDFHLANQSEYTFNKEIPVGTRAEIIDVSALKRIHSNLTNSNYSEYMTLMLNRPDKLNVVEFFTNNSKLNFPEISVTVDTIADINLVREIYAFFGDKIPNLEHLISWLNQNPMRIMVNQEAKLPSEVDCSFIED
jgi:spore coat polysaccharide biosynthesis protein SpsF (cytidylyltransferase family)